MSQDSRFLHMVQRSPKYNIIYNIVLFFPSIYFLLPNFTKSAFGQAQPQLHHKIETKKENKLCTCLVNCTFVPLVLGNISIF
jgi:hypothetical protein